MKLPVFFSRHRALVFALGPSKRPAGISGYKMATVDSTYNTRERSRHLQVITNKAVTTRAGNRVRTDDLLITNQLLYQLSYAGLSGGCEWDRQASAFST
jgi:hypothetical protein